MTDQQLLELAAKAAGYEISKFPAGKLWVRFGVTPWVEWNPLEDDGDALRLAVKLQLPIRFPLNGTVESGNAKSGYPYWEVLDSDPYAATRKAIVRAAAEIGKTMGERA